MKNTIIYDAEGNIIDVCYSHNCKCIECEKEINSQP